MGGFSAFFHGLCGQQCFSAACSEGAPGEEVWLERSIDGLGLGLVPPNLDDECEPPPGREGPPPRITELKARKYFKILFPKKK